jgi:hypothetical protein
VTPIEDEQNKDSEVQGKKSSGAGSIYCIARQTKHLNASNDGGGTNPNPATGNSPLVN